MPTNSKKPDNIAVPVIVVFWVIVVLSILSYSCQVPYPLIPFER